jgi:hypothetical protein
MPSLDAQIDDLYTLPLDEFTDARTTLAKTLTGNDAKRVRALKKPTLVPWAVNQLYWHARPKYDALVATGAKVRDAQVAALEGRRSDVRAASDAHRQALADAVKEAVRLAQAAGSQPSADAVMRTLEAVSLATSHDEAPGHLTRPLQPSGFEALGGVNVKAPSSAATAARAAAVKTESKREEAARKKAEAAEKKREAEIKRAEAAVARARARMEQAQAALRATKLGGAGKTRIGGQER